jgi:hypothetical protein
MVVRPAGQWVEYNCVEAPRVIIRITKEKGDDGDTPWILLRGIAGRYHFAGISIKRGYINEQDVFDWLGPGPLKWWRRFEHMIEQERQRKNAPRLCAGWEKLAGIVERQFASLWITLDEPARQSANPSPDP